MVLAASVSVASLSGLSKSATTGREVLAVGGHAGWFAVYDNSSLSVQDNSGTVTNPTSHIVTATKRIFVSQRGTLLVFRMKYDDGFTVSANPVIKVFGRLNSNGIWETLRNQAGSITQTLTTAATTDPTDGTDIWTVPDLTANVVDKMGNSEFIVGVVTALTVSAGTVGLHRLEVKEL